MEVVNYTNLKNNLKDYLNMVSKNYKKVIITRNKNETPIVMISLDEYNENFANNNQQIDNKETKKALKDAMAKKNLEKVEFDKLWENI